MSDNLIRELEESDYHLARASAEVERLRQELAEARAALGEAWLADGEPLTQGIARLNRAYDLSYAIRKQLIDAKIAAAVATEREECAVIVARLADKVEACDYYGQGQIEAYRKAARVLRSRGREA